MMVLVAYATAHGSTQEIAERVAARLRRWRIPVETLSVSQVSSLSKYDAVVLGSAIHGQAWLPEATRFVQANTQELTDRRVWLFSVGMPGALPRILRRWAMAEGPKVVAKILPTIHPCGQRLFSGVARRDQFPAVSNVIFRLVGGRYGDFRVWPDIDEWADEIGRELTDPMVLGRPHSRRRAN